MTDDQPDRICGVLTGSGNHCDQPYGDCPWHDTPSADDAVRGYLENAHDHYEAGQPGHADKFVRRALDAL